MREWGHILLSLSFSLSLSLSLSLCLSLSAQVEDFGLPMLELNWNSGQKTSKRQRGYE
jgi:hypothetical protein